MWRVIDDGRTLKIRGRRACEMRRRHRPIDDAYDRKGPTVTGSVPVGPLRAKFAREVQGIDRGRRPYCQLRQREDDARYAIGLASLRISSIHCDRE